MAHTRMTFEDISVNWKSLMQTLPATKKREKKGNNSQNTNDSANIWFDDVDPVLLEENPTPSLNNGTDVTLIKPNSFTGLTNIISLDCEMVGVGSNKRESILARASIVNLFGHCIYDKYVKPTEQVTDYRTAVSGIRPQHLEKGEDFKVVQKEVSDILANRILVGHAVHNDLQVLYLDHPRKKIRDTAKYKPFRKLVNGRIPSLKRLSEILLGIPLQKGEHDSVEDAQAAMRIYTLRRKEWEKSIKMRLRPKMKLKEKKEKTKKEK